MENKSVEKAFKLASNARDKAYAPYSKFLVGSALKAKDSDVIFSGCNVENASFGATNCAERTAIFKMVSELGFKEIEFILILTDREEPSAPCGLCRQVISEFASEKTQVYLANPKGIVHQYKFKDLLPHSFGKDDL